MLRRRTVEEAVAASERSVPTYIFLHIPKTAGMTIRQIIERNYRRSDRYLIPLPPAAFERGPGNAGGVPSEVSRPGPSADTEIRNLARLPDDRKRGIRIVYGHTVFGVHEALPGPHAYITMLREPVSRVLSTYYHLRRRKDLWLHDVAMLLTLDEYAHGRLVQENGNMQTRILGGELDRPGGGTEETLEQAKRNIEDHFVAAGLTERFDETLLLWGKVLGWRKVHYVSRNVARDGRERPSSEVIRAIEDANALDAELYRFVTQRFEEQLARYPSFEAELARFRGRNALFRRVYPAQLRPFLRRMKRALLR
jgi:hypothetical protein